MAASALFPSESHMDTSRLSRHHLAISSYRASLSALAGLLEQRERFFQSESANSDSAAAKTLHADLRSGTEMLLSKIEVWAYDVDCIQRDCWRFGNGWNRGRDIGR
ncbi:MAG: hypothetical protein Q9185_003972 [Variospora sp. 1 TL-2023]